MAFLSLNVQLESSSITDDTKSNKSHLAAASFNLIARVNPKSSLHSEHNDLKTFSSQSHSALVLALGKHLFENLICGWHLKGWGPSTDDLKQYHSSSDDKRREFLVSNTSMALNSWAQRAI